MKQFAKFCTVLMALMLVLGHAVAANASGLVSYDGSANKFLFAPGTKDSPTNLFDNFQNVMPGDTVTERILIKNDTVHVRKETPSSLTHLLMKQHSLPAGFIWEPCTPAARFLLL